MPPRRSWRAICSSARSARRAPPRWRSTRRPATWCGKGGDDDLGYASPIAANILGKRTLVLFKSNQVVGLEAQTGHELWRQAWKTEYDINAATPLVDGNRIFVTSGYGSGCALFEVTASGVSERWRNKNLRSHINSPVLWQGAIYGIDNTANMKAPLVCLDLETGAVKWSQKLGGGALVLADGKLVILSEPGELIIGEASSAGFQPALRQHVLPTRCWVQPTVANGRVFCRNNTGEMVAMDFDSGGLTLNLLRSGRD
ncbi:MAG: PQQ-binding-like beta-propeller repeat protein [Chthoniobacter sp.]